MLRLYGSRFASAVRLMAGMRSWLNCDSSMGTGNPALLSFLIEQGVRDQILSLPVSQNVKNQLITLQVDGANATDTPENCRTLGTRVEVFLTCLETDLQDIVFLAVEGKYKDLYEPEESPFGDDVANKFHMADADLRAAGECLALEQWNASVFHSMRVLEHGLRKFARHLKVQMSKDIDIANWQDIIVAMEQEISRRRSHMSIMKQTMRSTKRIQYYYSEVAADFRHFKDAWRNHVAHGRFNYNETQAKRIYDHVGSFMQLLASGAPR